MAFSIDIGSRNTVIAVGDKLYSQATSLAMEKYTDKIIAYGDNAERMRDRRPEHVALVHPVVKGSVTDLEGAQKFLELMLSDLGNWHRLRPGSVRMLTSTRLGRLDRNVLLEALSGAGGGQGELAWKLLASAASLGWEPDRTAAVGVIDLGAQTTETAVFADGRVLRSSLLSEGGDDMTRSIQRGASSGHQVDIGWDVAERLKRELASALPDHTDEEEQEAMTVWGRRRADGLPLEVRVTRADLKSWIAPHLDHLRTELRKAFSGLPPEVAGDIFEEGLVLTGGASLLHGIDRFVAEAVGVHTRPTEQPLAAGVLGARSIPSLPDTLKS